MNVGDTRNDATLPFDLSTGMSRRRFLRQSFAFSALATLGSGVGKAAKPAAADSANLLMIGDWGYDESQTGQAAVAQGMRRYAKTQELRADALLFLGDNWYGDLSGGAQSPRWQSQFEQMYPASVFPGPAYATNGNHDYQRWPMSKVEANLEYARVGKTAAGRTRWTMPSLWYRFEFPARRPLVTVLSLDSNMPHDKPFPPGSRDFTLTDEQRLAQLEWLENELKKPRSTPFLAVMAHHPVYSNGPHGDHPTLIRDWDPLFRKHKVDLYLAGHDHDLQHLEFEGHPTSFWLSGGGGADLYTLKIEQAARGPFADKVYGFSHLAVTEKELILRHIDSQGQVLHAMSRGLDGKVAISA